MGNQQPENGKSQGSQSLPISFHSTHSSSSEDENDGQIVNTIWNRITSSNQAKMPIPQMSTAYTTPYPTQKSPRASNGYVASKNKAKLTGSRPSYKIIQPLQQSTTDNNMSKSDTTKKKKKSKSKSKSNNPEMSTSMSDKSQKKWSKNLQKAMAVTPSTNIINDISNLFSYRRRLAKGSSCCVLLCQYKKTKKLYALKEMNKHSVWNPLLYIQERKILKQLKTHNNIMTYFDSFIDNKCLYIASEYCEGGTLLDKIIKMTKFTEKIAAKYLKTILNVVDFIHEQDICHRDLKPNNIVFDKSGYV